MNADLEFLPGTRWTPQDRRTDFDVTNTVQVSSPKQVRDAVRALFAELYPDESLDVFWMVFHDFERLFNGSMDGYEGCDTVYHDIQHSLDITLCMARLVAGHELSVPPQRRLGFERAVLGVIAALFHDAGYIRETGDNEVINGASLTTDHVSRSAKFLRGYLPRLGMEEHTDFVADLVHYTGYEIPVDEIEMNEPLDDVLGQLLGSADIMAQMADRCYLEKCRDRLYPEFVLAGVAVSEDEDGLQQVRYQSGIDLLRQTPDYFTKVALPRLEGEFSGAYRYIEVLYEGQNPYMQAIHRSLEYLESVIASGNWPALRRLPPCFTPLEDPVGNMEALVNDYLAGLRGGKRVLLTE